MPIEKYPREFKVPLAIPAIMGVVGSYLVLVPFIQVVHTYTELMNNCFQEFDKIGNPEAQFNFGYFYVFGWIGIGLGFYILVKKADSKWLNKKVNSVTRNMQLLLQVVPTSED